MLKELPPKFRHALYLDSSGEDCGINFKGRRDLMDNLKAACEKGEDISPDEATFSQVQQTALTDVLNTIRV